MSLTPPAARSHKLNRRRLLGGLAAASATVSLTACSRTIGRSVPHIHGSTRGYSGLADLPYFTTATNGKIALKPELAATLPWSTDFHAHIGFSFFLAPPLDYHQATSETRYFIDCDAIEPPCEVHLDDYLNKIATPELLKRMEANLLATGGPSGSDAARTHTIPNLVAEMDALKVRRAVLLAVAPNLPWNTNPTDAWLQAVAESPHRDRFVIFGTVNPHDPDAPRKLRKLAAKGIRGVKLHPTMQQFAPDDPRAMAIYSVCDDLGLPVFFHAGRAGIEPVYSQPFARLKNYIKPAKAFPHVKFVFGHAGARDWREAIPIAAHFDNIWLEVEGQGVVELKTTLAKLGPKKLLFGSDFPFFPLAATMARVLMATEGDPEARTRILAENAIDVL